MNNIYQKKISTFLKVIFKINHILHIIKTPFSKYFNPVDILTNIGKRIKLMKTEKVMVHFVNFSRR